MAYSLITDLFGYLFLISFLCLTIGLIRPKIFLRLFKEKTSRKKVGLFFGSTSLLFCFLFGASIGSDPVEQSEINSQNEVVTEQKEENKIQEEAQGQEQGTTQETAVNTEPEKIAENVPKYEIVQELTIRYDGGKSFYVLIDSVSLENADFKNGIKAVVEKIVSEKGNKISVDILDDKATMDLYYRSHYASNQLGRVMSVSERNQIGIHLIASYNGEFEMGTYLNGLDFFPGANEDDLKVGKYVESLEFDASK